jgi:hypothetical protein
VPGARGTRRLLLSVFRQQRFQGSVVPGHEPFAPGLQVEFSTHERAGLLAIGCDLLRTSDEPISHLLGKARAIECSQSAGREFCAYGSMSRDVGGNDRHSARQRLDDGEGHPSARLGDTKMSAAAKRLRTSSLASRIRTSDSRSPSRRMSARAGSPPLTRYPALRKRTVRTEHSPL